MRTVWEILFGLNYLNSINVAPKVPKILNWRAISEILFGLKSLKVVPQVINGRAIWKMISSSKVQRIKWTKARKGKKIMHLRRLSLVCAPEGPYSARVQSVSRQMLKELAMNIPLKMLCFLLFNTVPLLQGKKLKYLETVRNNIMRWLVWLLLARFELMFVKGSSYNYSWWRISN